VGGRQERFCRRVALPGDDGHRAQDGMDPADKLQTPIARIQTDDPRAKVLEVNCPLQERPGKGSIVDVGRREQEQQW